MDMDETVRLSEARDLSIGHGTFASVQTSISLLLFTGKKSALNAVINQFDPGSYVYWRVNQSRGQDVHRVILMGEKTALYAKIFADGELRYLTVGELAEARNELDVPGLPPNRGFLDDRCHDDEINRACMELLRAQRSLESLGHGILAEGLTPIIDQVNGSVRRKENFVRIRL